MPSVVVVIILRLNSIDSLDIIGINVAMIHAFSCCAAVTAMWVYQTCAAISTTPDHCARVVLAAATPAHIQFATRYNTQTTIARSSNNGRDTISTTVRLAGTTTVVHNQGNK